MYISLLLLFYLYKHFIQANKAFDSKELSQSVAFFLSWTLPLSPPAKGVSAESGLFTGTFCLARAFYTRANYNLCNDYIKLSFV